MSGYGNDTVAGRIRICMGTKCSLMLLKGKESGKWDTQPWPCLFVLKLLSQYDCKHLCVIGLQSKADFVFGMSFSYCFLLSFILLCCMKQPWECNSIFFLWYLCMSDTRRYLSICLLKTHISLFARPLSHSDYPFFHLYLWYFYALLSLSAGIYWHSSSTLITYPWWMPHG